MVKSLLVSVLLMFGAATASAQSYGSSQHAIYGGFGFTEGGFGLGVDYEYLGLSDFAIGGFVRIYEKDDEAPGTSPGLTTFGAFIRPHFSKKAWDFYVSPGLAIISIDSYSNAVDDATTLGPVLAIGLMYELNASVALGVESMSTWVWLEEDWRGQIMEDMMLRFRVSF
jgi:hypothetical protein